MIFTVVPNAEKGWPKIQTNRRLHISIGPKVLKANQSETTETDLIIVAGTLTLFVATSGAAVFSYYEGRCMRVARAPTRNGVCLAKRTRFCKIFVKGLTGLCGLICNHRAA